MRPKVEYVSQGLSGVESSVIPRVTLLLSSQFKEGQTNLFSKVFILKCLFRLRKLRLLSLEDRRFIAGVVLSYKVINDHIHLALDSRVRFSGDINRDSESQRFLNFQLIFEFLFLYY